MDSTSSLHGKCKSSSMTSCSKYSCSEELITVIHKPLSILRSYSSLLYCVVVSLHYCINTTIYYLVGQYNITFVLVVGSGGEGLFVYLWRYNFRYSLATSSLQEIILDNMQDKHTSIHNIIQRQPYAHYKTHCNIST